MHEISGRLPGLKKINGMSVREAKKSLLGENPKVPPVKKENAKYVIKEEDVKDFQTLVDCISAVYGDESEEQGQLVKNECGRFLKSKIEELGSRLKTTSHLRTIQQLNIRTTHKKFVDKKIAMVLKMVHNSLSYTFEGINDILGDLAKNEALLRERTIKLRSELTELTVLDQTNIGERDYNVFRDADFDQELLNKSKDSFGGMDSDRRKINENALTTLSFLDGADMDKRLIEEPRRMTFLQLNELMDELFESKIRVDAKNLETRMPRRTMEAHLHEVFKNKFGLKNIVGENLLSFLHTLRYYSVFDTRARAFLGIIRNECEEEFLHSIRTIETTLVVLLKMFLYGGSPQAAEAKINQQVNQRINSFITLNEATEVIKYLYSEEDAAEICRRIVNEQERPSANKMISTREEIIQDQDRTSQAVINYKRFRRVNSLLTKIVTNYVYEGHLVYLDAFNGIFRKFDADQNGILSEAEFRKMIGYIVSKISYGLNATTLLVHLDPFNYDQVTYSACVTILSQIVTDTKREISLLSELSDR